MKRSTCIVASLLAYLSIYIAFAAQLVPTASTTAALHQLLPHEFKQQSSNLRLLFLLSPLLLLIVFGLYSVTVILYELYIFRTCPEAAEELQKDLQRAKRSLKQQGFELDAQDED